MSAPLKIGVIGVGVMGERHARVLRGLPCLLYTSRCV